MKNKLLLGVIFLSSLLVAGCGVVSSSSSSSTSSSSLSENNSQTLSSEMSSDQNDSQSSSNSSVISSSSVELGDEVSLEWIVSENVDVFVNGYDTLPSIGRINQTLVFSVEIKSENYIVSNVYQNDVKVFEYDGVYSVNLKKNTKIEVLTEKKIKELKVTNNPDKLSYVVDDRFDVTGLEVSVVYQDDTTEIVPLNSMEKEGYYFYPIVFNGGEDRVTIYYKDKSVDIMLNAVVELYVSINPNGGVISSEYLDKLAALNLKNYNVDANGVITFTHSNDLPQEITLPTTSEITKVGYDFISWGVESNVITNNMNRPVKAVASWKLNLVEVNSVSLSLEDGVPYLLIDGRYNSVDTVYLYLYEGQKKIEIVGDTYNKTDSNDFHVKFDLRNLSNKGSEYVGRWMDIRFNTVINGKTESMEFNVVENDSIKVDLTQKIFTKTHSYQFATYENKLKVYFREGGYEYNVSFSSDDQHDYVTFTGRTTEEFAGKTLQLSWWVIKSAKEDIFRTTTIGEDGSFIINIELDAFIVDTNTYAHITILDENNEILFGGKSVNFLQSACKTSLPAYAPAGSAIKNCVSYVGVKFNRTYYVGGNGTGLMIYSIDNQ